MAKVIDLQAFREKRVIQESLSATHFKVMLPGGGYAYISTMEEARNVILAVRDSRSMTRSEFYANHKAGEIIRPDGRLAGLVFFSGEMWTWLKEQS